MKHMNIQHVTIETELVAEDCKEREIVKINLLVDFIIVILRLIWGLQKQRYSAISKTGLHK